MAKNDWICGACGIMHYVGVDDPCPTCTKTEVEEDNTMNLMTAQDLNWIKNGSEMKLMLDNEIKVKFGIANFEISFPNQTRQTYINTYQEWRMCVDVFERWYKKNKNDINERYWKEAMAHRMPFDDEVARLLTAIKGFYYEDGCDSYGQKSLIDFHHSKRPYGNKSVAESIAFNLGWDWRRRLTGDNGGLPDWVEDEAMKLHWQVLEEIRKEELENE